MQAQLFRGEGGIGPHPQLVVWEAGGREPRDVKARGTGAWGRKGTAARARAREGSGVRARVAPSGGALTPKPPPPPVPTAQDAAPGPSICLFLVSPPHTSPTPDHVSPVQPRPSWEDRPESYGSRRVTVPKRSMAATNPGFETAGHTTCLKDCHQIRSKKLKTPVENDPGGSNARAPQPVSWEERTARRGTLRQGR